MNTFVKVMHANTCNCAACTLAPTLGIKMPYEEEKKKTAKTKKGPSKLVVGENDLATAAPKVTAMLSEKTSNLRLKLLLEATENSFLFALTANKNLRLKLKMSFIL